MSGRSRAIAASRLSNSLPQTNQAQQPQPQVQSSTSTTTADNEYLYSAQGQSSSSSSGTTTPARSAVPSTPTTNRHRASPIPHATPTSAPPSASARAMFNDVEQLDELGKTKTIQSNNTNNTNPTTTATTTTTTTTTTSQQSSTPAPVTKNPRGSALKNVTSPPPSQARKRNQPGAELPNGASTLLAYISSPADGSAQAHGDGNNTPGPLFNNNNNNSNAGGAGNGGNVQYLTSSYSLFDSLDDQDNIFTATKIQRDNASTNAADAKRKSVKGGKRDDCDDQAYVQLTDVNNNNNLNNNSNTTNNNNPPSNLSPLIPNQSIQLNSSYNNTPFIQQNTIGGHFGQLAGQNNNGQSSSSLSTTMNDFPHPSPATNPIHNDPLYQELLALLKSKDQEVQQLNATLDREREQNQITRKELQLSRDTAQKDRTQLITQLRLSSTAHQTALEQSLDFRRRAIGRIVLVDDPGEGRFGGNQVEMWYNGVEFEEKTRSQESLQAREVQLVATLKLLKKVQEAKRGRKGPNSAAATNTTTTNSGTTGPSPATTPSTSISNNNSAQLVISSELFEGEVAGPVLEPFRFSATSSQLALTPQQLQNHIEVELRKTREDLERVTRAIEELQIQKKRLIHDERLFLHDQLSLFGKDETIYGDGLLLLWMLGKGGFSEVFCAYDLNESRYCAAKIHSLQSGWSKEKKNDYIAKVQRECDIQMKINHPHIVKLYSVIVVKSDLLMLVLEQCTGGDLDQLLKQRGRISEAESVTIMAQVLHALRYLKWDFDPKQTVIHYDLKPANILFHNGVAKVADFGLSKIPQKGSAQIELSSPGAGTLDYQPPECFKHDPQISHAVDMWACGVIMYQMLCGHRPFDQTTSAGALHSTSERFRNEIVLKLNYKPDHSPDSWKQSDLLKLCIDFINSCLEYDPLERLTVEQALKHPLFSVSLTPKGASDGLAQLEEFHRERHLANQSLRPHHSSASLTTTTTVNNNNTNQSKSSSSTGLKAQPSKGRFSRTD